jgi:hypothetical protein
MRIVQRIIVDIVGYLLCLLLITACRQPPSQGGSRTPATTTAHPTAAMVLPRQTPLPGYIAEAIPGPGEYLRRGEYYLGRHGSGEMWSGERVDNSVCVQFVAGWILMPGDFFDTDDILSRIAFAIDDETIYPPRWVEQLLEKVALDDENGNTIASAPQPTLICWQRELEAGVHTAKLSVRKTSGQVLEYDWSFALTRP